MKSASQDALARDLLFGVLALQLGLARADQVVEAGAAWAADRSRAPGQRLRECLQSEGKDCALVDQLLQAAVGSQHGDAGRTLASFGGEQVVLRSFGGSVAWSGDDFEPTLPGEVDVADDHELEVASLQVSEEQAGRYAYRDPKDGSAVEGPDAAVMGRGGMGRVLLAYDSHVGRELAMKELLPEGDRGEASRVSPKTTSAKMGRFLREARITGQLEHPNIVPVYELGLRPDGRLYYTMKVVRGKTLTDALKACDGLTDRLGLLNHFVDLCLASAFAHSRGVVHRDIKPDNVMLGAFGETVLVDWGLAKSIGAFADAGETDPRGLISDELEVDAGQTMVGTAVGTPAYMSPEQAEGKIDEIDPRSDVWSLGAVLFELLTGRRPFEGVHPFEVIGKVLSQEAPSAHAICPDAPPELCALADKALSRDRGRRFGSAKELADEVGRFLSGGQVALYAYSPWEQLKRYAAGHKALLSVAAVTLLLLFVLAPTVTLRLLDERDLARHAQRAARLQRATAQLEGARTAWLRGMPMEARSKLRAALEIQDTPAGRGFFREMADEALMMQVTMTNHGYKVDFSPKGLRLAVGSNVGQVYLADLANMDVRVLRGQAGRVSDVAFSPDGTRLATCSHEGTVRLLRLQGQESSLVRQFEAPVAWAVDFSPDGRILAVGGGDRRIRFWDVDSGELLQVLEGHEDEVMDLVFDPGGRRLASASLDGTIGLWDVETGKLQRLLRGHKRRVSSVDFSQDGLRLVSGGYDRSVRLWDVLTGEQERILVWHDDLVFAVAFQDAGHLIASASKEILIHDAVSGRELGVLGSHDHYLSGLDFSADGSLVASAGRDGKLRVWRTTGYKPKILAGHDTSTNFAVFSPDGKQVLSSSRDGSIRVWDRVSGQVTRVLQQGKLPIYQMAFSPDGRWMVSGGREGNLFVWNFELGTHSLLVGHDGPVASVAMRSDGRQLASASWDGKVGLWTMPEGKLERMLSGHRRRVLAVSYSPDGLLLASGGSDHSIHIWDPRSGKIIKKFDDAHKGTIYGLAFSPDGRWLASAGSDGQVTIWRVSDWQRRDLPHINSRAHFLDFSQDGKYLALALANGMIRVWRFDSQQGLASEGRDHVAHPAEVNDVTFSPKEQLLASTGDDGSLRLWRLEGDRLRSAWRDGLAQVDEQGRLTWSNHAGWFVHEAGETRGPAPAAAAWQKAVDESLRAEVSVKGRMICLQNGEGRLQFWDQQADAPLEMEALAGLDDLVALESGCVLLFDGKLRWLGANGQSLPLADKVRAIGSEDDGGFYALSASRILRYDPHGRLLASRKAPPAVSRVLWLEDGLLLGYKDGGLEFHPKKTGADVLHLDDLSAQAVTRLIRGPGRMVVAGFADGQVGMWDLSSGGRNLQARLHGGVRWLKLSRDGLLALSELGQVRLWDFRIFQVEHCGLLRKVWKELPRIWEDGRPVLRGPDPEHSCLSQTD